MMRAGALNSHVCPVITEMTDMKQILTSHVCSTEESKLKGFLVDKILSQICSTDKEKLKGTIVDKYSTKEDKS